MQRRAREMLSIVDIKWMNNIIGKRAGGGGGKINNQKGTNVIELCE